MGPFWVAASLNRFYSTLQNSSLWRLRRYYWPHTCTIEKNKVTYRFRILWPTKWDAIIEICLKIVGAREPKLKIGTILVLNPVLPNSISHASHWPGLFNTSYQRILESFWISKSVFSPFLVKKSFYYIWDTYSNSIVP